MASITYVFGDLLTGNVIEEIRLISVSMTRGFGQGELRGTLHLDQTGKTNADLIAATLPGRTYVICERDEQPIWGGYVWTRTYQSQSKTLQLFCRSFEEYPESRTITADFENLNTEQRNIFRNLWTSMMADSNSVQFNLPASFSNVVLKSSTVKSFEFKTYRSEMDSIANGIDGFDWTIDVAKVGGSYVKSLRIGYPTLGATEFTHFDYGGSVINYWQNDSMAKRGTHFYGIGAGEGSTMLIQPVVHSDLISSGFPRFDIPVSMKSINDDAKLTSLTTQIANTRKPNIPIVTLEVKGDQTPEFGSYGLGDAAKIHFDNALHPNPFEQEFTTRILGFEYYPPSDDHVEYARLVFEGEEL